MSEASLFYAQAAAAVHFLFSGEDGKYREQLLAYVGHYYSGQSAELDVEKAFGMSADALGKKVTDSVRQ